MKQQHGKHTTGENTFTDLPEMSHQFINKSQDDNN